VIVMKFGGTSVGSAERIARVAEIVQRAGAEARPVVVTSAMAGVTDELERLIAWARSGERSQVQRTLGELLVRHEDAAAALSPRPEPAREAIADRIRELRVLLRGLGLVGTATPASIDALIGFGELLAQELVALALGERGLTVEAIDARDVIVTDERFGAARPDLDATRARALARVAPAAREGRVPVLGGYLGATADGRPTTLGRGGSDLSASVLGRVLEARRIEIWTDVDGLMTADPRLVSEAATLTDVTFNEAAELAGFGAKVLHPAAVDPAIQGGVPVVVRNSWRPDEPGTLVGAAPHRGREVTALASREDLALVTLRIPGLLRKRGLLTEILSRLEQDRRPPLMVSPGPLGVALVVPDEPGLEQLAEPLSEPAEVVVERGLGVVAMVGEGLAGRPDVWARFVSAAGPHGARRVTQGPMGSSIGIVVPGDQVGPLMRWLHRELIVGVREPREEEQT
jgi:aspartate kinase